MDVMLYSFVLAYLMTEFGMSKSTGGLLNSLTLIASAIGGLFFGVLADRVGRTRALMASILVYSISSAACGFSHSIRQLAAFRFLLGLGMGGEWSSGAALIAETWRAKHRGRALGLMQSTYAIGEALAAVIVLRSEEHTSELQSRLHLVCRLLLEKKKTQYTEVSMLLSRMVIASSPPRLALLSSAAIVFLLLAISARSSIATLSSIRSSPLVSVLA